MSEVAKKTPDMSVSEWLRRLICASLGFGVSIIGAAGGLVVAISTLSDSIQTRNYLVAACVAVACVSTVCGKSPKDLWINRTLFAVMGGLAPLPRNNGR